MILQQWIHHIEEGAGARVVRGLAVLLGFVMLAVCFNLSARRSFSNPEAMEVAQLARNLSEGKGYTTLAMQPLDVYLLQRTAPKGSKQSVLARPIPELNQPPVYPVLLASFMKVFPFRFEIADSAQARLYQPERLIGYLNQLLFFVAIVLLFQVGRRLFDQAVAWTASTVFALTELFWRFSVSGLSTMLLIALFLGLVWCLIALEERDRGGTGTSLGMAATAGLLTALAGLTRYSFVWLIVPVLLYFLIFFQNNRGKLIVIFVTAFVLVTGPWLARNYVQSGNLFGRAGYTVFQQTVPFPDDRLERSLDPEPGLNRILTWDYVQKLAYNGREILESDLPRVGGSWLAAFFLVGLLVPYRSPALARLRLFALSCLVLFVAIQALGQTRLSLDYPAINSENLLVVFAPLLFVFGAGLFFTLLDGFEWPLPHYRMLAASFFCLVLGLPLLLGFFAGPTFSPVPSSPPAVIQQTAEWMNPEELMMSDSPAAVAWYGQRLCIGLTLDSSSEFLKLNNLRPIQALYLTERTSNSRFLSEMIRPRDTWGRFFLECWSRGEVPTGFPLRKAPLGLLPAQCFLSDRDRWSMESKGPNLSYSKLTRQRSEKN